MVHLLQPTGKLKLNGHNAQDKHSKVKKQTMNIIFNAVRVKTVQIKCTHRSIEPFQEIMSDRPKTDQPTDPPTDGHECS